jgi:hypothetical protein
MLAYVSLLVILVSGVAAGFMGDWWGRPWIWISIGLLLAIATAMYLVGTKYYIQVRHAVGQSAPQDPTGTTFEPIGPMPWPGSSTAAAPSCWPPSAGAA